MGHVNILGADAAQLRERIERAVEAAVASLGPRFQRNASGATNRAIGPSQA